MDRDFRPATKRCATVRVGTGNAMVIAPVCSKTPEQWILKLERCVYADIAHPEQSCWWQTEEVVVTEAEWAAAPIGSSFARLRYVYSP